MTFTCGHESPEPMNMGRGAARQQRLAVYFARPCHSCVVRKTIAEHTDYKNLAGELWTALAREDENIARLYANRLNEKLLKLATRY